MTDAAPVGTPESADAGKEVSWVIIRNKSLLLRSVSFNDWQNPETTFVGQSNKASNPTIYSKLSESKPV